jgi:hypothetical protein
VVIPESEGKHVKIEDVVLTAVSLIPNGVSSQVQNINPGIEITKRTFCENENVLLNIYQL